MGRTILTVLARRYGCSWSKPTHHVKQIRRGKKMGIKRCNSNRKRRAQQCGVISVSCVSLTNVVKRHHDFDQHCK